MCTTREGHGCPSSGKTVDNSVSGRSASLYCFAPCHSDVQGVCFFSGASPVFFVDPSASPGKMGLKSVFEGAQPSLRHSPPDRAIARIPDSSRRRGRAKFPHGFLKPRTPLAPGFLLLVSSTAGRVI